ncbi:hypothetical protein [Mycobacterium kubicae]|uniref:hypothetical protein n=1 Tax=Mycobacterium kubicae TaxID=120959 RepID=UPI0007FD80C2|nr:hypothetical protein [Mycobacterium kubicae]OBF21467.1 hypothetical protein A5725_00860 [Mycobacterium kubicae]OBK45986.1 hypothetical protein A5657_02760 [Mycobacterium kubicae]
MSKAHTDIGPELRRLAQAALDSIDPAVRAAAAVASSAGLTGEGGKCQQVWCPVCALAALLNGEQHPLLTVVADQGVALLDVLRGLVNDAGRSVPSPPDDAPAAGLADESAAEPITGNGAAKARYEAIPITVQD